MKGQIWSMDFVASVVILALVLVPALFLWQDISSNAGEQKKILDMEQRVLEISDALANTQGSPENWTNETVALPGLKGSGVSLSGQKISMLNETSYQRLKNIFGYDFYISIKDVNGTLIMEKGKAPASETVAISKRAAIYNNRIVSIEILLWTQ